MATDNDEYRKLGLSFHQGVATVSIDNPPINLLDRELFRELRQIIERLEGDESARVIVFRSAVPGWFIAHYDVNLILGAPPAVGTRTEPWLLQRMTERLRAMPKATIAVLEGRAGGGGAELASSCDMRFATPQAILTQPETALGLIPGGSGSQRLPRLVGRSRALEIILGCDDIDAATAERWGWVNRVLSDTEVWPVVTRLATRIASFPPYAVAASKAAVLLAEGNVVADLVREANLSDPLAGRPETQASLARFLAFGGQTVDGERRLAELAAMVAGANEAQN